MTVRHNNYNKTISKNKKQFFITDNGKIIHKSILFRKVLLLKTINKNEIILSITQKIILVQKEAKTIVIWI